MRGLFGSALQVGLLVSVVHAAPRPQTSASPAFANGTTCATSGQVVPLSISQSKPSSAVQVPGNFIGFGFETAFLNDFANTFSENLVESVAQRLGQPVIIRIGGSSGDLVEFNPNQRQNKVCVSGDCSIGSSATYILGPSYFKGFKSFPNQHFTFQAPLGPNPVNTTGSLDYVTRAYSAIGASRVDAIAIGNEPDLYDNASQYVQAALSLENQIVKALGLSPSDAIFEVLDLSTGSPTNGFTVQGAFSDGLDQRGNVKYAAQHWYQNTATSYNAQTLQSQLMSHNAITSKFASGYSSALNFINSNYPSVSYILSETGSSLQGPPLNYDDGFGACLWAVDFNLYSMSQGVKRVDGSGRPAATHSLWVPDSSANAAGPEQNIGAQVRGPYYALPMLADFLGTSSGAVTQVLGEDTLTAYALYNPSTGALSKVALVNLNYWSADTGGTRQSVTFAVPVPKGTTSVTIGRLQASYGAHALGYDNQGSQGTITWEGETWSYQLDRGAGSTVSGVAKTQTVDVCNGVAYVIVPASEVVVVYI